ncbi:MULTISPECIES: sugar phosphate isomerase/epimerase family protein [Rhizobium]|uniref:D-psicose/D-tagatose/L-ribulose 3-epimerase n=1 Tax=Rhizobium tropici TaxID=398 RepID=A0A6P1C830_RHITR|nr:MULTISPECIES: sugar phosphate isomerase/epimerase family protein [Rhizobium]AGB75021.1 xylose isomerase domain-containing protein [Rhizobium tropici CIAT 899]MBB4243035.1 D-psicose/D-tagatose/L-ribulose 3-epimerase [Rhizobium tropici]MBB5594550.1 D-psicose/D-tagatose/L-ribulose 3-epimerase [Rhizobium tropici]MBB6493361.1 D-psicose/D-tagatose/L-ribulose 3-epimerase [Rhizobium tropici]NEV11565.1 sugar phosphate isomerase/epimerase [Rhizobium tropici]
MSKIGVHSFVWSAGSSKEDLEKALTRSHELGFQLIEFSYLDPKLVDVKWLASRIEELSLDVAISMGLPAEGDISSEDPTIVAKGKDILDRAVALVRDLGGTKLAGILSSAHGKQERTPTKRGWDTSISTLSKVADQAKTSGVTLNLEIVNRFESNMLNTAAQGMAYIRDTGASNVFLHLDTFHMNIEEADVGLAIRHASDKIGYVHIGESHRGYLGTGNIDFAAIFDALVAVGWNDYVTFESFSTAIVDKDLSLKTAIWRNLWDDNVALARHARQFIELGLETASRKAELVKLAHLSG